MLQSLLQADDRLGRRHVDHKSHLHLYLHLHAAERYGRRYVDGLRVQDSTTEYMIRSVAQLISSISQSLTLLPGTLISTGSPGGAGRSRKPPLYLMPGTEVTVTIEGIGALTNHCVKA